MLGKRKKVKKNAENNTFNKKNIYDHYMCHLNLLELREVKKKEIEKE